MAVSQPVYLVNPYADPVILKINGRASYLNAAPVREFFDRMMERGKTRFAIDFINCSGMDSTFLGILAGVGLDLRKHQPPGRLLLCRLGPRNMELVNNLGLNRIVEVASHEELEEAEATAEGLEKKSLSEEDNARMILSAHENLVQVDDANRAKFQDVIAFLKNQVGEP